MKTTDLTTKQAKVYELATTELAPYWPRSYEDLTLAARRAVAKAYNKATREHKSQYKAIQRLLNGERLYHCSLCYQTLYTDNDNPVLGRFNHYQGCRGFR